MKKAIKFLLNKFLKNNSIRYQILAQIIQIDKIKSIKFGTTNFKYFQKNKWLEISTDLGIFPYFFRHGFYEIELPLLFTKNLEGNKKYVFIDAGANIGLMSLQLNNLDLRNNISKYILIDPNPNVYDILLYNAKSLPNSCIIPKAISNSGNDVKFYINENDSDNSDATLIDEIGNFEGKQVVNVSSINLDDNFLDYLSDIDWDALIYKSDLQGYDLIAFSDFSDSILSKLDLAVLEIYPKYFIQKFGLVESINHLNRILSFFNYSVIIENEVITPLNLDSFENYFFNYEKDDFFNVMLSKNQIIF